jgi:hypothetical protein
MTRRSLRTIPVLGVALAAAVVTAGAASGHGSQNGSGRVIQFRTMQVHQTLVDHAPAGFSVDDVVIFSNDLYQGKRKIGEDGGTCTVVRFPAGGTATMQCTGTNRFADGQITVAGLAAPGEPFELAITGGTGKYRRASGQVVGRNTSDTEMEISLILR